MIALNTECGDNEKEFKPTCNRENDAAINQQQKELRQRVDRFLKQFPEADDTRPYHQRSKIHRVPHQSIRPIHNQLLAPLRRFFFISSRDNT